MADASNKAAEAVETEAVAAPAPARFRVLHGAVAGSRRNKKGEMVDHDFYAGSIVSEADLDGLTGQYLVMGAIEPLVPIE